MKNVLVAAIVVALAFGGAVAQAGQGGNCSPEGTWYGYNTSGDIWIVTITRSGPNSYTTVMDFGAIGYSSPVAAGTDWRGELVKTGPKTYDWTTMALLRAESDFFYPFALGFCPATAEFTSCDSWEGQGVCSDFYGFFTPEADPFEDGDLFLEGEPLHAFFKRMPMTYPTP